MEETQAAPESFEQDVDTTEQTPQADTETEAQTEQVNTEEAEVQGQTETFEQPETQESQVVEEESYAPVDVPSLQPFDLTQFADPSTGEIDLAQANQGFTQALQQAVAASTQTIRFEMQEQNEWNKAVAAYPELRKDVSLRSMVQQLRAGSVIQGDGKNYLSPKQAADKLFKLRGAAVQEGVKQAQTHTRVQESAALETSDIPADPSLSRRSNLKAQMQSGNYKERESAKNALLKDVASSLLERQLNQ